MRRAVISCGIILFLVTVYVLGGPHLFKSRLRLGGASSRTPADVGLEYETIHFRARDEGVLRIAAWWLPARDRKRAVLLVHGGASNKRMPWTGGLELARDLVRAGYSVVMPDMRNHGDSDGSARVSFGADEAGDLLGAIDFLASRDPEARFSAIGFSMGGSAVLHAAAVEPRIEGVVAGAVSNDFREPLVRSLEAKSGLPGALLAPWLWSGELQGVLSIPRSVASAIGGIGERPVLLLQNEADPIVPLDHLTELARAIPTATVWVTRAPKPGHRFWQEASAFGTHARSYLLYPEEFMERTIAVLEAAFDRDPGGMQHGDTGREYDD